MSDMGPTTTSGLSPSIQTVYAGMGPRQIKRIPKLINKMDVDEDTKGDLYEAAHGLLENTHPDFDRGGFQDRFVKRRIGDVFRDRRH